MAVQTLNIVDQRVSEMFTLMLLDNGIMHIHISEVDYEVEHLERVVPIIGEMTEFRAVPFLVTLHEKANPNTSTRNYWSKKENCPYSIAEAYITKSIAHKLIGNFYLQFHKPERSTQLFTSESEAFSWLESFL
jgi:hypothetical protein